MEAGVDAPAETVPSQGSELSSSPFQHLFEHGDTHALRNPHLPQQIPRVFSKVTLTEAQKATRKIRAAAEKDKHANLILGLDSLLEKHALELEALAKEHSVGSEYLSKLRLQSSHFKDKRNVNLNNAKIHAKAVEVNGGKVLLLDQHELYIEDIYSTRSASRGTKETRRNSTNDARRPQIP